MRPVRHALVLYALLALRPTSAQADAPVRLEWEAPVGCPSQTQVLERTRGYLKIDHWPQIAEPLVVRAKIAALGAELELQLQVTDSNGTMQRTLTDRDCEVLTNGAALLLAIALAPKLAIQIELAAPPASSGVPVDRPSPSRPPSPSVPSREAGPPAFDRAAPRSPLAPKASPLPERRTPIAGPKPDADFPRPLERDSAGLMPSFALGAGALLYSDLMPAGPSLGVELAGELFLRPLRVTLSLGYVPPIARNPAAYPSAELSTSAVQVGLSPCVELPLEPVAFGVCVCGEVGSVSASVGSIDLPSHSNSARLGAGGGLSLRYTASRHVGVALDARLLRSSYDLHFVIAAPAAVELHRTDPLSARLSLRIAWLF